ncbi:tetratricopeptide repeat protein [Thermosipho melanesiensis]|uniref:tetratricopeptide repeat protein n=1 Tax=Thermosipho melanesiensis TaxID=46541 RepID=UPI00214CFD8C|nr:tetratricopeptide repeat protein [Thermosipho melanesiensis]
MCFSILLSLTVFSYTMYDLQLAVGERNQEKVLNILNAIDYEAVSLEFKCEIILAYTDLYFWGKGNVDKYQDIAREYIDDLLDDNPTYWKVYYTASLVYGHYVQRNYLLALFYYGKIFDFAKKAVEYGQDEYLAHLLYGILNLETPFGDIAKAKVHLLKALDLNPEHVYTYVELGKYYEKIKDFQMAKKMYKKALEVDGLPIWKAINIEGKNEARKRLAEVEKKCTKR